MTVGKTTASCHWLTGIFDWASRSIYMYIVFGNMTVMFLNTDMKVITVFVFMELYSSAVLIWAH